MRFERLFYKNPWIKIRKEPSKSKQLIIIHGIIMNQFKLEIQSKRQIGLKQQVQSTEQSFQSTDPVPGNFPGSGNFLFPVSVDCAEFFSRLNHAWKLSGFRFSRLNRVFSRLNHAWAVFQPYSNEEQTLPKCNRRNIGSKGLCQSTTRPYMFLDASPKHD